MSVTKTSLIAALVLILTFGSGVAVGMLVDRVLHRRGPRVPGFATDAMVHRLDRHLALNDEQEKKIAEIITRRHERINSLWGEVRPKVRQEIEQTNREIAQVLTPEQRQKFEKMKLHMERRRGERGHRP